MRAAGICVIFAHENDPELGGCEFATFFRTTPQAYAPSLSPHNATYSPGGRRYSTWASFGRTRSYLCILTMAALTAEVCIYSLWPLSTDCDRSTPQELITDGLYARVAVAFHTGQHRAVSLCLLAQEIIKNTSMSVADKVVDI